MCFFKRDNLNLFNDNVFKHIPFHNFPIVLLIAFMWSGPTTVFIFNLFLDFKQTLKLQIYEWMISGFLSDIYVSYQDIEFVENVNYYISNNKNWNSYFRYLFILQLLTILQYCFSITVQIEFKKSRWLLKIFSEYNYRQIQ